jgi:hypothetical protein
MPPSSWNVAYAMFAEGLAMPMNSPALLPPMGATVVE